MNIQHTPLAGLHVFQTIKHIDDRGYFTVPYEKKALEDLGIKQDFMQDNLSVSHRGVLRGLHLQIPPFPQAKLVRVLKGKVWDVAVDIRKSSATYGQFFALILSEENQKMMYIPSGFLHGFVCLEDQSIFAYKVSAPYNKASEMGVVWDDAQLSIPWKKLDISFKVSHRDKTLMSFEKFEKLNPFIE